MEVDATDARVSRRTYAAAARTTSSMPRARTRCPRMVTTMPVAALYSSRCTVHTPTLPLVRLTIRPLHAPTTRSDAPSPRTGSRIASRDHRTARQQHRPTLTPTVHTCTDTPVHHTRPHTHTYAADPTRPTRPARAHTRARRVRLIAAAYFTQHELGVFSCVLRIRWIILVSFGPKQDPVQ